MGYSCIFSLSVVLFFVYATGPEIYRRAIHSHADTAPAVIHDPLSAEDINKATAPIRDQLNTMTQQRDAAVSGRRPL